MKKILKIILFFFCLINFSFANSGEIQTNSGTIEEKNVSKQEIKKINEEIENKEENTQKTKDEIKEKNLEELEKEIIGDAKLTKEELETIKKQEKKDDNIIVNAYKTRRQQVFDLIKESPEQQKINDTKEILKSIKVEKELNKQIYKKLQEDISNFNNLKKELAEKQDKIKKLEEYKAKTKQEIKKLEKEKKENINLRIIAINKQKEIERKKIALEQSKKEIKKKEGLEERYKLLKNELIKEKIKSSETEHKKTLGKLNVLYIFLALIIFLYTLRFLVLNHTNFKKKHTKLVTVGELGLGILIVVFLIWYFFYLFPNLYILVIFLSGYLLLVNAHLIASFMGSLIVVNKYSVGEVVKIENYLGKIEKIGTVYTIISEIDEKGFMHKNYKYIPNVIIVKEGLEKVKDYTLKQRTFTIKLALNKQNTIFKIIDHIKNNILMKFINSRPKHLDPKNNDVFEIKYEQEKIGEVKITFFWFSTEEVSKKIKSRIIGYIEKETCSIEENNFDDEEEKKEEKNIKKEDDLKFVGV